MILLDNFHLLRPLWLMAFIPLAYVVWQIWQRQSQSSSWQQLIPAHLLEHLLEGEQQTQQRWPAALAAIAGTLAILALAGPTWRQIETPVEKSLSPVVLVTDLSASMLATDMAPNRLTRLKQKLTDILRQRDDGVTAIVAYAGSSHVVAPLTDDSNTLINLVQALDPSIMPLSGSKPEQGMAKAIELLNHGASTGGTVVLATDGLTNEQSRAISKQIAGTGHTLSILGVGSETGAPIPGANGALLRDRNGGIIMAQLERGILQQTAQATGGHYHDMSLNNADIDALIPKSAITDATVRVDRHYDSWYDEGRWLTLLLLPLVLAGFRRGLLLPLFIVALLTGQSGETVAQTSAQVPTQAEQSAPPPPSFWQKLWDNAWQTPDQQAQQQLEAGNSAAAAALFNDPAWRAEALDRSGKHAEAAQLFGEQAALADNVSDKANDFYNQANALARAGDLEKSLAAYDQALEQNPDLDTAKTNRKIVENLLKQQQQEQQKQQKQNQQEQQQQEQKEQQNQQDDKDSSEQNQQEQKPSESSDKQDKSGQQNQSEQESQQQEPQQQESQPQEQEPEQQTESGAEEKQSQSENESAAQSSNEQQEQEGTAAVEGEPIDQNEEQTEAWLRRIPDNPGDLLRRKFEQQQRRNTVTAPRDHQL